MVDEAAQDICRAFMALFRMSEGLHVMCEAVSLHFLSSLMACLAMGAGSYAVKVASGRCLCCIISCAPSLDPLMLPDMLAALRELFSCTDSDLVVQSLRGVARVVNATLATAAPMDTLGPLADDSSLSWLCSHPDASISDLANTIVDTLHRHAAHYEDGPY
jgi:hypothetical protein